MNETDIPCLPETHALEVGAGGGEGDADTAIGKDGMMTLHESLGRGWGALGFPAAHGRKTQPRSGNSSAPA